ncbi:phage antirepressor [Rhodococcus sp. A5(2022)]|uniref:phage antirepressor n=1 Tax=Rhodococcus sp. A5(2022) TaxID=3003588 RepID=UPI0022A8BF91|nr:phage antirepressor KilAC domain-containing protein [Rhodococcus sp. A5(2022)]MCZ1070782.1 BRO family protein [Rhodococcus sp. A5(2022)]
MSDIQTTGTVRPFQYGDTAVRTIDIDGEPWFVASDVARILEYRDAYNMARRLDDEDRGTRSVSTPSGDQQMTIVSEPGFYTAILGSQCAKARDVKRWLTHEVLPTIRKTGGYSTAAAAPALTGAELLAHAVLEAQQMLAQKDERIAELEPKADLADTYLTSQGGARLVREVAKILGWKEKDLRRWLIEERMIFAKHAPCGNVQYDFYAEFVHHFQSRETIVNHTWGTCSHYTLFILPRGVELIRKRMARPATGGDAA